MNPERAKHSKRHETIKVQRRRGDLRGLMLRLPCCGEVKCRIKCRIADSACIVVVNLTCVSERWLL